MNEINEKSIESKNSSKLSAEDLIIKTFCSNISEINSQNECGWTPLYRTIIAGNLKATEALIQKGANPNIQCNMGETPLFQAVDMEKIEHVKLLLKHKADPNLYQSDGITPLHNAVIKQNVQIVQLLLSHNANPNFKTKIFGQTPVHLAIKNNVNPTILLLLVQYNGSLVIKDKNNYRPIDYVNSDQMKETLKKLRLEREEIFRTPQKGRSISLFNTPNGYNNLSNNYYLHSKISSEIGCNKNLDVYSNTCTQDPGPLHYNIFDLKNNGNSSNRVNTNSNNINGNNEKNGHIYSNSIPFRAYSNLKSAPKNYSNNNNNETNSIITNTDSYIKTTIMKTEDNFPAKNQPQGITEIQAFPANENKNYAPAYKKNDIPKNNYEILKIKKELFNGENLVNTNINTSQNEDNSICSENIEDSINNSSYKKDYLRNNYDDRKNSYDNTPYIKIDKFLPNQINFASGSKSNYKSRYTPIKETKEEYKQDSTPSRRKNTFNNNNFSSNKNINYATNMLSTLGKNSNKSDDKNKENDDPNDNSLQILSYNEALFKKNKENMDPNSYENVEESDYNNTNKNNNYVNHFHCITNINIDDENIKQRNEFINNNQEILKNKHRNSDSFYNSKIPLKTTENINFENKINGFLENEKMNFCKSKKNLKKDKDFDDKILKDKSKNKSSISEFCSSYNGSKIIKNPLERNSSKNSYQNNIINNTTNNFYSNGRNSNNNNSNKNSIENNENNKFFRKSSKCSNGINSDRYSCSHKNEEIDIYFSDNNNNYDENNNNYYRNSEYSRNTSTSKLNRSKNVLYRYIYPKIIDLNKLYDWLKEINLLCYYPLFIEKGLYSVDQIVEDLKNEKIKINYEDFEEFGITKPGHIFRMISKLEVDANIIGKDIYNLLTCQKNKFNTYSNNMKVSKEYFCGCNFSSKIEKNSSESTINIDISSWLKSINLSYLKDNFLFNGFEMIEFLILQMFSSIPIDDHILKNCLNITNENDRDNIIFKLNKDIKFIMKTIKNGNKDKIQVIEEESNYKLCIIF